MEMKVLPAGQWGELQRRCYNKILKVYSDFRRGKRRRQKIETLNQLSSLPPPPFSQKRRSIVDIKAVFCRSLRQRKNSAVTLHQQERNKVNGE